MGNFHPLEVVGRGSETQLLVGENLNYLIQRFKVYNRRIKLFVCNRDRLIVKLIFVLVNLINP